jgi:hypothetical protein
MWHVLLFVGGVRMASEYPETSKQGTAGKRKHVTLTIPQELEIIRSV